MEKEESLHDWLRRIRKVDYKDEKKEELRFTYESGEEVFPILKDESGRYVEVEKAELASLVNPTGRYYLVEIDIEGKNFSFQDQYCIFFTEIHFYGEEFEQRVDFQRSIFTEKTIFHESIFKKEIVFRNTTFLGEVIFSDTTFLKEADFEDTTFSGEADFGSTKFLKSANFSNTGFLRQINFSSATFSGEAKFNDAAFSGKAYFNNTTFSENANFDKTIFLGKTYFSFTKFLKEAVFSYSKFHQEVSFFGARFVGVTRFYSAKIDFLNFFFVQWGEEGSKTPPALSLDSARIGTIDYAHTEFPRVRSRNTYLILKNLAIKQNDAIRALEFYQQEMEQHYRELSWLMNPIDKLILGVEKIVSSYGTDPFRATGFLIGVNYILVKLNTSFDQGLPFELIMSFFTFRYHSLNGTHLAALILNPFLIYEVIKSLRKFSRKL